MSRGRPYMFTPPEMTMAEAIKIGAQREAERRAADAQREAEKAAEQAAFWRDHHARFAAAHEANTAFWASHAAERQRQHEAMHARFEEDSRQRREDHDRIMAQHREDLALMRAESQARQPIYAHLWQLKVRAPEAELRREISEHNLAHHAAEMGLSIGRPKMITNANAGEAKAGNAGGGHNKGDERGL